MGEGVLNNVFYLLGGMAVMLFGMHVMGNNLERVAGNNLKKLLGKMTSNRFAGVGVGAVVTGIIQSSAATTVMLVGFVNVGLMTLVQATSVIMGANIGTTVTAQILSLTGVGFDAAAYACLIAAVGAVMGLFIPGDKIQKVGYILLGLGMIFLGLEVMSMSVNGIIYETSATGERVLKPIFDKIFRGNHFPLLLILIGAAFTALIQSSSALTGILIALSSALNLQNAVFIILGSNIGTCVTALISSIGTSTNAKRTALIHLLFNLFGCLIVLAPIWIWEKEFTDFMVMISGASRERQIANFHTIFNVFTTIVLLPFTKGIVYLATKLIRPKKEEEENPLRFMFIDERLLETPPIAVNNTKKEIVRMCSIAKQNIDLSVAMLIEGKYENASEVRTNEEVINFLNRNITSYLTALSGKDLTLQDEKKVGSYYHVVTDVERVGDYAENIMEYALRLKEEGVDFSDTAKEELHEVVETVDNLFDAAVKVFDERDLTMLPKVDTLEEMIDEYNVDLETKHIERLKKGDCSAQVGSVYLQTISNLERVGDHITNIAFSIKQYVR